MTILPTALTTLVESAKREPATLYVLENELMDLVHFNHPCYPIHATGCTVRDMVRALVNEDSGEKYIIETLRLALVSLWPFVEETPTEKFPLLRSLYAEPMPPGPLPQPHITRVVSDELWERWTNASKMLTLASLRTLAQNKGLRVLHDPDPDAGTQRYVIVRGDAPGEPCTYKEAIKRVEAC
jgi:hypothetical protein